MFIRMSATTMTFTTFLRQSGPALEEVVTRDIRLQRRDGDDLYLKRADREEADHESLAAAGQLLAHLVSSHPEVLLPLVEDALPWSRFLPDDNREEFVGQFLRTIEAAASLNSYAAVGTLLKQWKNTAEVWANPELRAKLEQDLEPGDPVERPGAD